MSRCWIVNASPLILLGKVDHAFLLTGLADELLVPEAVVLEVGSKPGGRGVLEQLASSSGVRMGVPIEVPAEIGAWDLGAGESQVLALAQTLPGSRSVLDDLAARRCAQVLGALGVVLRAKNRALLPAARPVVAQLLAVGLYASPQLIEQALARVGE
jgi:predicted nucleic acid-binding protein